MFTLPDLPYDYSALEPYIDEETMHLHHDKHHGAYVKNLNEVLAGHEDLLNMEIEELVKNLRKVPEDLQLKVRNNGGQHYNHSLFWKMMRAGNEVNKPEGELLKKIEADFGSWEKFQEAFTKEAMGRFGSGWAFLVLNNGKLEIMSIPNGDNPLMEGKIPLLALDVWEHAYYLKYKNMRADYIKAWWKVINWKTVSEIFSNNT